MTRRPIHGKPQAPTGRPGTGRLAAGRARLKGRIDSLRESGGSNVAFYLFCAFIVSYFCRFARRIPALGTIRIDVVLAGLALAAVVLAGNQVRIRRDPQARMDPIAKRLWILLAYIVLTIPFVEWPGSVIHNLEGYARSVCFFFLVILIVDTTRKLHTILAVYTATQVFRVLEPLYMHLRSGYWGDYTSLGNWEYMDRLSGSPFDIINPNGLGFVVVMTLPLLHFLIKPGSPARKIAWGMVAIAMCYALVLSASRSGFLALVFLCLFAIWRSKHRGAYLTIALAGGVLALVLMTPLQRERYVSIFSHKAKGGETAELRVNGIVGDFKVSLRRPLFGHGLGTSREANANFRGYDMLSHDLYLETAEELGYVGLALVLALIWSFIRACLTAQRALSAVPMEDERLRFLHVVADSLVVVVAVDLFFSFASFGLSEPYWYFIGGLSVVTARLASKLSPASADLLSGNAKNPRRLLLRGRAPGRPLPLRDDRPRLGSR